MLCFQKSRERQRYTEDFKGICVKRKTDQVDNIRGEKIWEARKGKKILKVKSKKAYLEREREREIERETEKLRDGEREGGKVRERSEVQKISYERERERERKRERQRDREREKEKKENTLEVLELNKM
uniref:Uncharacterized protein n=1 Tax=Octopus bimaculoides TaxID=37653 RepID=A0A0L8GVV6_OCTBM